MTLGEGSKQISLVARTTSPLPGYTARTPATHRQRARGLGSGVTTANADLDGDLDAFIGEQIGNTFFFENTGCGNGGLDAGEACDDGNTANGDGCSATCQLEVTPTPTNTPTNTPPRQRIRQRQHRR